MADEPTQPGAPPPLTDAQELLVLAQRLDGFMEWLGGPNHTGWIQIRDIPGKVRDLASKMLLAAPQGLPFPKDAYEAEFMQKAGYAWIAQNKPERLTQLARDNRDAVLEQAGLVADGWMLTNFDESANTMAHNIGNDIRALKSHQPKNPARPLASASGTANTPENENASPEAPQAVHYHVTERTGVARVAESTRDLPCDYCDWGHPPGTVLDMRGLLRRTTKPDFPWTEMGWRNGSFYSKQVGVPADFEPDLDTEAPFQAGRPIL